MKVVSLLLGVAVGTNYLLFRELQEVQNTLQYEESRARLQHDLLEEDRREAQKIGYYLGCEGDRPSRECVVRMCNTYVQPVQRL